MNKSSSIQVIDRAAMLLDAIAQSDEPLSLKILSAETQLHPSTAFRILASLGEVGYVARDSAGHYQLGRKLLKLAGRVRRGIDIRKEALDIMRELRDQLGETINLTVREGDEVIYVERVSARRMMRVDQVVGSRAPLHVTAVGKLMLGELGDDFVLAYAQRTGLAAFTPHTITSVTALLDEVHTVSEDRYALDNEEAEEGVGCIGTVIHDNTGAVVGGLSVSAPLERRSDDWIPLVMAAAERISERLGYFAG
ncbi:MAG: IclR family transcriptional regulator [Gammaproteobacteria bacterium]|nr:IclR family transcriptional regulator [Gammaproteobacteria bacterium]